jgi:DNA invertase Pin-like site-specific DNA recombinase
VIPKQKPRKPLRESAVDEALELYYQNIPIKEILQKTNISRATLYRYIKNGRQ